MKNRYCILWIASFLLIFITGCRREENTNGLVYMEGMEHLLAWNEYGYYFDVYSETTKDKVRDGIINMGKSSDDLYIMVESAGQVLGGCSGKRPCQGGESRGERFRREETLRGEAVCDAFEIPASGSAAFIVLSGALHRAGAESGEGLYTLLRME